MAKMTRRRFLQLSSATLGAFAFAPPLQMIHPTSLRPVPGPTPWWSKGPVETTMNYCEMCLWHCGIKVHTQDGRVVKIEGHPDNPKSNGKLCARGHAGIGQLYDPDRLKRPLLRVGPRGEGQFRAVSWEEALDYAAEKLLAVKESYGGPEAVAWFGHGATDAWFVHYLPNAWASPNAAKPSTALCTGPRETAATYTFGRPWGGHGPVDWESTRMVVLLGTHVGENAHNTLMQDFAGFLGRGGKLVVVDPRFSTAASKADMWLPIKPGTDTALLLAWIHTLIDEDLYDQAYVEKYTVGFDRLKEHAKSYTAEWAADITELPAESIRHVARELGRYRPQAIVPPGRNVNWHGNDTQRMRALYILNTLLGNYGRPGGSYIPADPWIEEYPHPPFPLQGSAGG